MTLSNLKDMYKIMIKTYMAKIIKVALQTKYISFKAKLRAFLFDFPEYLNKKSAISDSELS